MIPELSPDILALLFAVALGAGFVDSIAGGGGLITIPTLLLLQIPPLQALAVNKIQGCTGAFTAAATMMHKGVVSFGEARGPSLWAFGGAALGTTLIQQLDASALDALIPIVLLLIAAYFAFGPKSDEQRSEPRLSAVRYRRLVVPLIGFYDGFFGPGTGSFFTLAGVALRGQPLLQATGMAKCLNFATNLASAALFIAGGKVLWLAAGVMILGQVSGATLGSHTAIRGGARIIRPLIITVCLAMTARYVWQKHMFGF